MMNIRFFILSALIMASACIAASAQDLLAGNYKKALIIGAHPDDPESMAYGTALRLREMGCDVVTVYLPRGEAGIPGKTHDEAAAIRTAECEKVTAMTGIPHLFLNQIDGSSEVTNERYLEVKELIERENPGPSTRTATTVMPHSLPTTHGDAQDDTSTFSIPR